MLMFPRSLCRTVEALQETVTPQTDWWLSLKANGVPLQLPLAISSTTILATLSIPVAATAVLMLPAALPLLCLAPILVMSSLCVRRFESEPANVYSL